MWQPEALAWFQTLQERDPGVLGMEPYGSVADGTADAWSDLDIELSLTPEAFGRYFPALDWLAGLGEVWVESREPTAAGGVTRVILTDGRHLDIRIQDGQVVDERSPLKRSDSLKTQANDFAFMAAIAIEKIVRNDLLIGSHLAKELQQTVLILAMQARDRELGTTVHRFGGPFNDVTFFTGHAGSTHWGILSDIRYALEGFQAIVGYERPRWRFNWQPLETMLSRASRAVEELQLDGETGFPGMLAPES